MYKRLPGHPPPRLHRGDCLCVTRKTTRARVGAAWRRWRVARSVRVRVCVYNIRRRHGPTGMRSSGRAQPVSSCCGGTGLEWGENVRRRLERRPAPPTVQSVFRTGSRRRRCRPFYYVCSALITVTSVTARTAFRVKCDRLWPVRCRLVRVVDVRDPYAIFDEPITFHSALEFSRRREIDMSPSQR